MKKITSFLLMGVMVLGTSCQKYLDINENPNQATGATPALILPQALTATASNLNGFNSYGSQLVGYMANAGGYGGFGSSITYNFSSGEPFVINRWTNTYDNLEDYQTILNSSDGKPEMAYFNAAARIMKAHGFQLLVDTYNDVPYSQALKGADKLTPAYDDAKAIYKSLADELDKAIALINAGTTTPGITPLGNADVVFKGNMSKWKQLANTIKLRVLLRGNGKVQFANQTFDAAGFLTEDALINPGYTRDNGRQNPKWDNWGFSYTGSDAIKSWMPNTFVYGFYHGEKLSDPKRGAAVYYQWPSTPNNRLGYENNGLASSPSGSFWYPSTNRDGKSAGDATGVLKGPNAGFPLITASESYFMQAEAAVRGITTGAAATLFNKGIDASFTYLYTKPDGSVTGAPVADAATYRADNAASPLVNFALATSPAAQLEAILTQKYIALNMVNADQSWNDYRRTGYPTIVSTAGATGTQTFASTVSQATAADKLPTRILYPTTEASYNTANVPQNISVYTSKIFWAR